MTLTIYIQSIDREQLKKKSNPLEARLIEDSDNIEEKTLKYFNLYNMYANLDSTGNFKKRFIKSGVVTKVPWEDDAEFKELQRKNNAYTLMVAYKTILPNPGIGEEHNVHLAAKMLQGTIIEGGEIFSQNRKIGPYVESRGFRKGPSYAGVDLTTTEGGGVCKVASTLYNLAVLSNLEIIERYNHSMPVPYVPYGQDATVSYGSKDIKFKNNTDSPILIWAQGIDNVLFVGFYSDKKPPKVEWHHKMLARYKAPVIYKNNPELDAAARNVIVEGMDGGIVESWVTIESEDGSITTRELGKSYYNAMPHIIEKND